MNNMGIFSKSNKNKKDKEYKNFAFPIFGLIYNGKIIFQIVIYIFDFETFLNSFLSQQLPQKLWNDIKELYGKDVDEKELFKVFKLFALMYLFENTLEDAKSKALIPNVIRTGWGYAIYRDKRFFDGQLDEKTFRELLEKIAKYHNEEFLKKYKQNEEQKDEQSK
jgi:hypothetical protein